MSRPRKGKSRQRKGKIRLGYTKRFRHIKSGSFVKKSGKGIRSVWIRKGIPKQVFRHIFTGRFVSPTNRLVITQKVYPKQRSHRRLSLVKGSNLLFHRKIQLRTQTEKSEEYCYLIPYVLEKGEFTPSFSAIERVLQRETVEQYHTGRHHVAYSKVEVVFMMDESSPESETSWTQLKPMVLVDSKNAVKRLYESLLKFLRRASKPVFSVVQIQLSILRLP